MKTTGMLIPLFALLFMAGCDNHSPENDPPPDDIGDIFRKELYNDSTWALRIVDLETEEVLYDQRSDDRLFIGSVRKVFTMAEALEALGPEYTFRTPVYRQGTVNSQGVLEGDLVLVAAGDFTMGGRRNANDTMAITNFDHNEANTLGNAELTTPDILWGYDQLAEQVAASGISAIAGEIIIDDRLFQPFDFRRQFNVRSIFVNDDIVDVTLQPANSGELAIVEFRPESAAFTVDSNVLTVSAGVEEEIDLVPEFPTCFGQTTCSGSVIGQLPVDFVPPLTGVQPLVQTFRIARPDNYARTVFIEALERAGVSVVNAAPVAQNPVNFLPPEGSYTSDTLLADLVSLPLSEYTKFVLKISYNIGADTSLVLWGLSEGVDNMADALSEERDNLTQNIGIPGNEFEFFDGSGGGDTIATSTAVLKLLKHTSEQSFFPEFLAALPILGVDGSLAHSTGFESDPTLAGAKGNAFAKTGTYATGDENGILIKGRSMAGFVTTKSGRDLMFSVVVNNVQLGSDINELAVVADDQATITAIIWRDY